MEKAGFVDSLQFYLLTETIEPETNMKRTLSIEFPWPPRGLSPNARLTVFAKASLFKKAKQLAFSRTKEALNGEKIALRKGQRMNIQLVLEPPVLRYHDEDNLLANCKATLDGIAMAMGINDHFFHFREQIWKKPDPAGKGVLCVVCEWEEADA